MDASGDASGNAAGTPNRLSYCKTRRPHGRGKSEKSCRERSIANGVALVPVYGRREDQVVQEILRNYGYEVYPIDGSDIILTNSAIHCISKTAPKIGPQT